MPSIVTSVAFVVCQESVADCPFCMEFGSTEIDAVGDAGGGGGGGGGGAAFFLQAPSIITTPSATTRANHFMRSCFTLFLPNGPRMIALQGPDEVYLFPTPVWL